MKTNPDEAGAIIAKQYKPSSPSTSKTRCAT